MDKYSIIRALYERDMDIQSVLAAYNIRARTAPLEEPIQAFVWVSRRGRYYVIANEALSPGALEQVFWHELCHILNDSPRMGYWVGLDRQKHKIEQRADMFHEIAATYMA